MVSELVILIGLPASGKSTFYRERYAATHDLVSKDLLRGARQPERRQRELVEAALAAGRSVVVDNTNARAQDREPLIAQARAHGARVVGCFFLPNVRASIMRNRSREGTARVPDVAIFTSAKRLEAPSPEEGFDALMTVDLHRERGFEVHASFPQTEPSLT
jgi:predicted kinase